VVLASLLKPLEQAGDFVQRFIRRPELRLMCVETDAKLRRGLMQVMFAAEHLADNKSPVLPVQFMARADDDETWGKATHSLRDSHERRTRGKKATLNAIGEAPDGGQGSANFASQALETAGAVKPPGKGLLLLMMPTTGVVVAPWLRRFSEIVFKPQLAPVRFILLCERSQVVADWIEGLDEAKVLHHRGGVDEGEAIKEAEAEIEPEERLGPGFRGAWPRGVVPPPLPAPGGASATPAGGGPPTDGDGTETPAEGAEAAGVGPREIKSERTIKHRMRMHVKRAALAKRKGDGPTTIREQAAARDLCLDEGRIRDAVTMELMLGAYMIDLEQRPLAIETYDAAAKRATEAEEWDLAAQAHSGAATCRDAEGQTVPCLRSHRSAIAAAKAGGHAALALLGYWDAGQVALRVGLEMDCISLWADAIAYARDLPDNDVRGTKARFIAEEEAKLLQKHRRYSEARELEQLARTF
jgi:hypothetical protein